MFIRFASVFLISLPLSFPTAYSKMTSSVQSFSLPSCGGTAKLRLSSQALLVIRDVKNCQHLVDQRSEMQHKLSQVGDLYSGSFVLGSEDFLQIQVRSFSGFFKDYVGLSIASDGEPESLPSCSGTASFSPIIEVEILNSKRCNTLILNAGKEDEVYHQVNSSSSRYAIPVVGSESQVTVRSDLADYRDSIPLQFRCFDRAKNAALKENRSWFITDAHGYFVSKINEHVTYRFRIRPTFGEDQELDVTMTHLSCDLVSITRSEVE